MAKLNDKTKCNECGTEFDWFYLIAQKMSEPRFDVETIPDNWQAIKSITRINDNTFHIRVHCPKCDNIKEVDYQTDIKITQF